MSIKLSTRATPPGVGPIIPQPLFNPGVSGFTHRYAAERLSVGAFTAWPDAVGNLPMVPGSSNVGALTVQEESGLKSVRVDNSTSGTALITTEAPPTLTSFTVAMMVRKMATTGTDLFAYVGGARFLRPTNAAFRLEAPSPGQGQLNTGAVFTLNAWHLLFAVVDGTAPAAAVDGTTTTAVTSPPFTPSPSSFRPLGFTAVGNASDTSVDIAEAIIWPSVLDSTQRAAVRAAFKARYSALP